MATIGLDNLVYAPITSDDDADEEYGEPKKLAKAMTASLSVELNEATLYADDGAAESVKEFKSGTLSLGIDNIGTQNAAELTGATVDKNGVLVSSDTDIAPYVAVGFRAKKANGKYRYFWLYRVKFGIPSSEMQTKGDSITFSTPTIDGTIYRRNKADSKGRHNWKAEVTNGEAGVSAETIKSWFTKPYEPEYSEAINMQTGQDGPIVSVPKSNKTTEAKA